MFKEYTLRDLVQIKNGKNYPNLNKIGNTPVYGTGGLMGYTNVEGLFNGEAILLPRKGSLTNIMFVNEEFWTVDTMYYAPTKSKDVELYYLYNYLKLLDLSRLNTGSGVPSMTFNTYYDLKLSLPDLSVQQKISKAIRSINSKINTNTAICDHLNKTISLTYNYWFTQFDFPDKQGNPYKQSSGKMRYSEELKRDIPINWKVVSINDVCEIVDCLHSKKPDIKFEDNEYYLMQLENIDEDGTVNLSDKYFVSKKDYLSWTSRIEVKEDDLVITNAGRVGAVAQLAKGQKMGIGRNITAIRPKSIEPTYLYLSFAGAEISRQIKTNTDSGAFFGSLNVKGIKNLLILKPDGDIEYQFEKIVRPLRDLRDSLKAENQDLQKLHNWLLPMLMTGKVEIGDL